MEKESGYLISDVLFEDYDERNTKEKYSKISPNIYQEIRMGNVRMAVCEDKAFPDLPVPLHSHTFYELSLCRSKEPVYYLLGTRQYLVGEGDIIMVRPGTVHKPIVPPDHREPFIRTLVCINRSMVESERQVFTELMENDTPFYLLHTKDTEWAFLASEFDTLLREYKDKSYGYEGVIVGTFTKLLFYITRAMQDLRPHPEKTGTTDQVLAYIDKNLAADLSVKSISDEFHISESALTKLFRAKLNTSPHSYIMQRRLELAKRLIAENGELQTVYRDCGYEEYSSFYRAFRKEYGISPQGYREIVQKNDTAVLPLI